LKFVINANFCIFIGHFIENSVKIKKAPKKKPNKKTCLSTSFKNEGRAPLIDTFLQALPEQLAPIRQPCGT
jgi:hypothetical protein